MNFVGVIPARFASTRFPGKPLAMIQGRPMIQWTIEGAQQSKLLQKVIVATDDQLIADAAKAAGAEVAMTASELPSGSDRIYAAIKNISCDIVVNIQGDEPLVTGELIDRLAQVFIDDPSVDMATLAHPISVEELNSPNAVKVVLNHQDEALYFSRFAMPYSRISAQEAGSTEGCLKHIGMYAYKKDFLAKFCHAPQAVIEKAESLEQLRALYLGAKIKVVRVKEASLGVDTPQDLQRLEKFLQSRETHG